MFKELRSDQKGVGLVLVLIVCSLVGAASLYLMDLTKVSQQKIALDARVQSYQSLVKIVTNQLHTGNNCTEALGGTVISSEDPDDLLPGRPPMGARGAFDEYGMSITLNLKIPINNTIKDKPLKKPNGKDVWFLQGGTSVRNVLLNVHERVRTPVRLAPLGSTKWVAALGHILIVPGHPGVGIKLARNAHYKIPIFLYYTVSGSTKTLVSCSDPAGEAYFCTMTGGAYNSAPGVPEDQRCNPDRSCYAHKPGIVFSASQCPPPYTTTAVGPNLFICNWCNRNQLTMPGSTAGVRAFFYEREPTNPPLPPLNPPGSILVNPDHIDGP